MRELTVSTPHATDYFGIISALGTIENLLILEHGVSGTAFTSQTAFRTLCGETLAHRLFTTGLTETDIVNGNEAPITDAVRELDHRYAPEAVALVATGIDPVIGIDLQVIADELRGSVQADLVVFPGGGFMGSHEAGEALVYTTLLERYARPVSRPCPNAVNILGLSATAYNHRADCWELNRLLGTVGIHVPTILSVRSSIQQLREVTGAALNIVAHDSALPCARYLEAEFGMPYIFGLPYGYAETRRWIHQVTERMHIQFPVPRWEEEERDYQCRRHDIRRRSRHENDQSAIIAADFFTALGLTHFVSDELGGTVRAVVLPSEPAYDSYYPELTMAGAERVHIAPQIRELRELISELHPSIVMGDSDILAKTPTGSLGIPISFPVWDRLAIFNKTPYMGLQGSLYLTQEIANHTIRHTPR